MHAVSLGMSSGSLASDELKAKGSSSLCCCNVTAICRACGVPGLCLGKETEKLGLLGHTCAGALHSQP